MCGYNVQSTLHKDQTFTGQTMLKSGVLQQGGI